MSHVAVYYWIKSYGSKLDNLTSDTEIEFVELDEMHSYIGKKKLMFGYGLLLIGMQRDSSTSLWVIGHQRQEDNYGKALKIKV